MKNIRVTGKGQIKVRPDITRIRITLEDTFKDYARTLQHSADRTKALRELLEPFGFTPTDLKTLNFQVNTAYESYQKDGVWKQRFKGYTYTHELKIEFPSDNERLGKILYALANSDVNPVFQISYTISQPEEAKNAVLGQAIEDAKKKAEILSKAAGVPLGEIQHIDYSWTQIDLEVRPMMRMDMAKSTVNDSISAYDLDIEPDDINLTDTVTVEWEIG